VQNPCSMLERAKTVYLLSSRTLKSRRGRPSQQGRRPCRQSERGRTQVCVTVQQVSPRVDRDHHMRGEHATAHHEDILSRRCCGVFTVVMCTLPCRSTERLSLSEATGRYRHITDKYALSDKGRATGGEAGASRLWRASDMCVVSSLVSCMRRCNSETRRVRISNR